MYRKLCEDIFFFMISRSKKIFTKINLFDYIKQMFIEFLCYTVLSSG